MVNYGFVKCAIATCNSKLSNPVSATKKIKDLIIQADSRNVKVLVFPELSMTGYTCQDLFGNSQLLESTKDSLKELVTFSEKYDVLFVLLLLKVEKFMELFLNSISQIVESFTKKGGLHHTQILL